MEFQERLSREEIELTSENFGTHFVLPERERSLVSLKSRTLASLAEGKHVVTLLIDGFGFDMAREFLDEQDPFLSKMGEYGKLERGSSQWPATTTCQITTMHTGLPVEQHGLIEWVSWLPEIDLLASPLPMSHARSGNLGELIEEGIDPDQFIPPGEFYPELARQGFEAYVIQPSNFIGTPYSQTVCRGAELVGFKAFRDGCVAAADLLTSLDKPSYISLYIDTLDSINHRATKNSRDSHLVLSGITANLNDYLFPALLHSPREAEILLTSDHGHMSIDPNNTVYLNRLFPDLNQYLQRTQSGEVIPCSGGCRSMFLHVQPERREELRDRLSEALNGIAHVYNTETLVQLGVFDSGLISERFANRVGNLVVLPFAGESVYYLNERFEVHKRSAHGGATAEEMHVPWFTLNTRSLSE